MGVVGGGGWWRREGSPRQGFRYLDAAGAPVTDPAALERIRRLRIPPGWRAVRIAPEPGGPVEAWGIDRAGRRQYLYGPAPLARRERRRWRRALRYGRLLPRLRAVTGADLARPGLGRAKVLALAARLMARGLFRAGGERYARRNRTFGLCTLAKRHVAVHGSTLVFRYTGKGGRPQRQVVADTPLAEVVRELLALPGRRLLRYIARDGCVRDVTATALNAYLRAALGARCTAKDARTFGATVRAATVLAELGPAATPEEAKRNVALCCRLVALELGNTPAVARRSYIHPAVLREYLTRGRTIRCDAPARVTAQAPTGHYPEEEALLRFLARRG